MKTIAALAAVLLGAGAANAFPYPVVPQFTDAKSGYIVKIHEDGADMVLDGRHPVTHQTFHISVSPNGEVRGNWAAQPVNFVMPARSLDR